MSTDTEQVEDTKVPYVSAHVSTAVVSLQAAVRGLTAYPPGHTIPASLVDRAHKMVMQAAVEQDGTLEIEVDDDVLLGNDHRFRDHLRAPQRLAAMLKDRALRALLFRADLAVDAILASAAVLACDTDVLHEQGGAALVLLEASDYGVVAIPVASQGQAEGDPDERRWNNLAVDVAKNIATSGMESDEAKSLLDVAQSPEVHDMLAEAAQRLCGDDTSAEHLTELLVELAQGIADPETDADAVVDLVQQFLAQAGSPDEQQLAALLTDPAILAVLSSIGMQAASKLTKVLEALNEPDKEGAREDASLLIGNQAVLLRRLLDEETDPYEYRTLLDALVDAFPEQVVCGQFDEALATVQLLKAHADGRAPEGASEDAAAAIERIATRYVLQLTLSMLAERTSTQDAQALHATVVAMGNSAVPGLAGLLEEAQLDRLRDIVRMLCSIGTPEVIEVLDDEMREADLQRGRCIVETLRHRPGRPTTSVLLACLGHKEPELRQEAAFTLGQLHDPEAVAGLGRIARRWSPLRRHGAVRREAVRALGGFRESAAADELANVALGRHLWRFLRDIDVRMAAVRALARHESPKAGEYLELIAERSKGAVAAVARRAIRGREGVPVAAVESAAQAQTDRGHISSDTTVASAERG